VIARAREDITFHLTILSIADALTNVFRNGGKLLLAGNGGSAADAQHIAGEFLSRLRLNRNPLPAIALTTDTSVLTAVGNDYGYDLIFERQVRGLGHPGDAFIAISTSGRSPNILAALKASRDIGMINIAFTGNAQGANSVRGLSDIVLAAPSEDTPLVQQIHITAAHAVCDLVEQDLFALRELARN
jgi:D-sedoheptulose 7-phosphate isomerase